MELGLSTYAFPWTFSRTQDLISSLNNLVMKAAELQVHRVQVCDNAPLDQLSTDEHNNFLSLLRDNGVSMEVGTRGLYKDKVLKFLELAEFYDSEFLRVVVDDHDYEPSKLAIKAMLTELTPEFESRGIILALENHDRFKSVDYVDLIESTNPDFVSVCLDTVNSLGAGEGINEVLDHLAPYCINLHIKDITIRRLNSQMGFNIRGCPAGQGDLDLPDIIKRAKSGDKLKSIALELWLNESATAADPVAMENQWVLQSIEYLKKIDN